MISVGTGMASYLYATFADLLGEFTTSLN